MMWKQVSFTSPHLDLMRGHQTQMCQKSFRGKTHCSESVVDPNLSAENGHMLSWQPAADNYGMDCVWKVLQLNVIFINLSMRPLKQTFKWWINKKIIIIAMVGAAMERQVQCCLSVSRGRVFPPILNTWKPAVLLCVTCCFSTISKRYQNKRLLLSLVVEIWLTDCAVNVFCETQTINYLSVFIEQRKRCKQNIKVVFSTVLNII